MGVYLPVPPPENPPGPLLGDGNYPAQFYRFVLQRPAGGPSSPPYMDYPRYGIRDTYSSSYEVKPISSLTDPNKVEVALHEKLTFHVDIQTGDAYTRNMQQFISQRYMKDVSFIIRTRTGHSAPHMHPGIWTIDGITCTDNGNQTSVVQVSCQIFGEYKDEIRNDPTTP